MLHIRPGTTSLVLVLACLVLFAPPAAGVQDAPSDSPPSTRTAPARPKTRPAAPEAQAGTKKKSGRPGQSPPPAPAPDREPAPEAAAAPLPTDSFTFLDVGPQSEIDPTRKRQFSDYRILPQRSCIGCLCTHAFGNRLSESLNLLYGRSEAFKSIWDQVAICLKERNNAIPQIRSLLLKANYVDTQFSTVAFFFSEFTHKPVCFRMEMNDPKNAAALLTGRFGEPQAVENTWFLWERGKDLMLLDLFLVNIRQHATARLHVFFGENLAEHLRAVEALAAKPASP